jgi:antagonist of KipI
MQGPEWPMFSTAARDAFQSKAFVIARASDRMGFRFDHPGEALALHSPHEMISTAVTKGTVQVIPDGSPLVLMSDAQTTGGYPRIAQVLAADLPILAQKKPGDALSFVLVSDDDAEELYLAQIRDLLRLEKNLRTKLM